MGSSTRKRCWPLRRTKEFEVSNAAIFAAVAAAATECSGETCIVPSETLSLECGDSFSLHCLADNNCVDYEKLSGFP